MISSRIAPESAKLELFPAEPESIPAEHESIPAEPIRKKGTVFNKKSPKLCHSLTKKQNEREMNMSSLPTASPIVTDIDDFVIENFCGSQEINSQTISQYVIEEEYVTMSKKSLERSKRFQPILTFNNCNVTFKVSP